MPYWFKFSKNRRKRSSKPNAKEQKYLAPNNSTMNRICAAYNDIGNINLHIADIAPFNYQMLLSGPCKGTNAEICKVFCEMDNINKTNVIESQDAEYVSERQTIAGYDLLAKMIVDTMTEKFGSLEETYPHIVKFLFAGQAIERVAHKQMFWRVYGQIALRNIIKNMENYSTCEICKMKYPAWVETHSCPQDIQGFYDCVDCGAKFNRMNSRQCRCPECQEGYRRTAEQTRKKKKYKEMKEKDSEFTTSLVSRLSPKS